MEAVSGAIDHVLTLAFDENACVLVFSDVQGSGVVLVLEQVEELFVVNLKEGAVYCETLVLHGSYVFQAMEEVLDCSRDDAVHLLVLQEWILHPTILRLEA
jgi:hypothetical protein